MEKITVGQFLCFTNVYVTVYIEDEFQKYETRSGIPSDLINCILSEKELDCPIDYIRNVDGGHFGDGMKNPHSIVLGIRLENFEKYFKH